MHCDTLKQDNDSTVRGDGGSRVGEVRGSTTSPMPEHKGFKLQELSRDPLTPADGPGSVSVKVHLSIQLRYKRFLSTRQDNFRNEKKFSQNNSVKTQ